MSRTAAANLGLLRAPVVLVVGELHPILVVARTVPTASKRTCMRV
jgi:hypothetical protein